MSIAKGLWLLLFLTNVFNVSSTNGEVSRSPQTITKSGNGTHNEVVISNKKKNQGAGFTWGWGGGGGGGGSSGGRGWGWGWGGGGGGYWGTGCRKQKNNNRGNYVHKGIVFSSKDYKIGEFAQCMVKGRCMGLRLDCPLHCSGTCFYDCKFMCKAHCLRTRHS